MGRSVDIHSAILGLVPPCATVATALLGILRAAPLGTADLFLFVSLGILGAVSFAITMILVPVLRTTLGTLGLALTPTDKLLRGEPIQNPS